MPSLNRLLSLVMTLNSPTPPPPQSAFESEISELLLCQNEVDLALKSLQAWMKDEPAGNNLVSPGGGRGRGTGHGAALAWTLPDPETRESQSSHLGRPLPGS
jgi:hypothetical protein